jgi:hypothetical protein
MKRTTQLILVLTILFLLTSCGAETPAQAKPNVDSIVNFNEEEVAVLRGYLSGDYSCVIVDGNLRASVVIEVPVRVQGVDARAALTFSLRFDTELASSLIAPTTVRDYLESNSDSTTFDAFPILAPVEIRFVQNEARFEAVAIREISAAEAAQSPAVIDGIFSTNLLGQGTIRGVISGLDEHEGTITCDVSVPVEIHGIEASVILPVHARDDTPFITAEGAVPVSMQYPFGAVEIQFTREGDTLAARQISAAP